MSTAILARLLDVRLPRRGDADPACRGRGAGRGIRTGSHGDGLAALLRLRDRRDVPGRARGGLARVGVGPEHRFAAADAGDRRGRGGRRRVAPRTARPAAPRAASGSSRVGRWRTSRAWSRPAMPSCAARARTPPPGSSRHPPIRFLAGDAVHTSMVLAGRLAGSRRADDGRRRRRGAHRRRRARARARRRNDGPAIVALQAGDVHSGAFDDFAAAVEVAHRGGAWVHVDGAFGLWAAASPRLRHLVDGARRRRLVGDRRAQDAQRALRLRRRDRARRGRDDGGARRARRVPARGRERLRPLRPRPRALASRARSPGVGGAALARQGRASSALVDGLADAAAGLAAGFGGIPGPRGAQRRRLHPGVPGRARRRRRRRRWGSGCATRGRSGRRRRRGEAARWCASR